MMTADADIRKGKKSACSEKEENAKGPSSLKKNKRRGERA